MDDKQLFDSLLIWIQTLPTSVKASSAADLCDGVIMAELLTQIAPTFFTSSWHSKIKTDVHDNWRLKVSNLKKILKGTLDYYNEVLGQQIVDFHLPDVNAIGESEDRSELGRLLQLILGCAVNCEHKQEYIEDIMRMEESVQEVVMNAIQELMMKEMPGPGVSQVSAGDQSAQSAHHLINTEQQMKKYQADLSKVSEERDELVHRCHELDNQVTLLQEEKTSLVSDNERLTERLNQGESVDDPSTLGGRRYQQVTQKLEQTQEDCYRLEAARDDYKIKVELQEREIIELQQKVDELQRLAGEAHTLKDEVDVLRHTAERVAQQDQTIELYRRRLEEVGDVRRQLKILEERNTVYLTQCADNEEELRKVNTIKSQAESYNRQVQELSMKLRDETKRADKSEFERKRAEEKLTALQRERDRLLEERDMLKESNEELKLCNLQNERLQQTVSDSSVGGSSGPGSTVSSTSTDILDMMPPEIKEMYVKLQHENKVLRSQQEEKSDILQQTCDDLSAQLAHLNTENRLAAQRILQLEGSLEDVSSEQQQRERQGVAAAAGHTQLQERLNEMKKLSSELEDSKRALEEIDGKLKEKESRVVELESAVNKRDEEMKEMQAKYKRYLEQAKAVICALDPRSHPRSHPEVQALRAQLMERDRRISMLEKEADKARILHDQEKELVMSAWYNLSSQLHRQSTEERLSHLRSPLTTSNPAVPGATSGPGHTGQSFLARQRQISRRVGLPPQQQPQQHSPTPTDPAQPTQQPPPTQAASPTANDFMEY